jgi:hypothetical protein
MEYVWKYRSKKELKSPSGILETVKQRREEREYFKNV